MEGKRQYFITLSLPERLSDAAVVSSETPLMLKMQTHAPILVPREGSFSREHIFENANVGCILSVIFR